jgi:hypothetical protein
MVVKLPALRNGRHLAPRKIPGTHFCQGLSRLQGHSAGGSIRSMEKSNDLIGNPTRDLPACGVVPEPTVRLVSRKGKAETESENALHTGPMSVTRNKHREPGFRIQMSLPPSLQNGETRKQLTCGNPAVPRKWWTFRNYGVMKSTALWTVTLCNSEKVRRFWGIYRLQSKPSRQEADINNAVPPKRRTFRNYGVMKSTGLWVVTLCNSEL